ncbi:MAG TPA: hypothetical protein VGL97_02495 [Bryobacteraceae bacterium]|jgi:proteasome lid subunit RPN8/RPN11
MAGLRVFAVDRSALAFYGECCDNQEAEVCMTIQLKPEQELLVGQAIQAGLIRVADDVLDVGVETIRQRLEERKALRKPMEVEEWSREFHAWVHSHSTGTPLLSDEAISRDSIYGTRGL